MKNVAELLNFDGGKRMPVILQTEVAECGLACLAMVASYHGRKTDLNTLRRRFPVTLKGATLAQLISIAGRLDFTSRALRLEPEHFREIKLPAVLHWNMNHFVVLKSVGKDSIVIHNPTMGERTIPMSEVQSSFTGVALELTPSTEFKVQDERTKMSFSMLWQQATGIWRSLGMILLMSLALQLFGMLSPFYMQTVVDEVVISRDSDLLLTLAFGFFLLMAIQTTISWARSLVVLYLSNQLSIQISSNLFRHLLRLPASFFQRRHIGDVLSRFGSLERLREQLTTQVVEAVVDGVMVLGTLAMMLYYSVSLSIVVLAALALYAVIRLLLYRSMRFAMEESINAGAVRDSNFMETVRALQGIKLYGRESQRESLWVNHAAETLNAGIRLGRINITTATINQFLFGLEGILVVYLGAVAMMAGDMTVGMLFAYTAYKAQFSQRGTGLVDKWIQLRTARVHLDRVADIALSEPEPRTDTDDEGQRVYSGAIELKNVSFRHAEDEPWLLHEASMSIAAGESVAIIGPSGCGKSTLMKLMLGLQPPSSGELLVDGKNVYQGGMTGYRQAVGAVMQDDALLSGSIAENIAFFADSYDTEKLARCAHMAAILDDVAKMPMKFNTLIGDMGSSLSGGQRQRVLLARALYREPRILFLDEATSHLDVALERAVNHAIKSLNITRVIIAHRPETIRSADRVFQMKDGKLEAVTKTSVQGVPAAPERGVTV